MAKKKSTDKAVKSSWSQRVKLSAEESLKRMKEFPLRKEAFIASIKKSANARIKTRSPQPMSRTHLLPLGLGSIVLVFGIGTGSSQNPAKLTPFAAFVEDYFASLYDWRPSDGTAAGLHQYDNKLEDRSAAAVAARIDAVKKQLKRLESLGKLAGNDAIDAEILDGQLRAELLDMESIGNWHKNPMNYVGTPGGSVDGLMKRNFAAPVERLRSVIARLKATPALLTAMRANVKNPPKEFTDLAIIMADGSIGFFRDSVHTWAKEAAGADKKVLAEFEAANDEVVRSFQQAVTWLKDDLLPKSKGSYALGADNYRKQLLYEELVDIPLDKLLAVGEANLRRDQEAFVATAKKIDPTKTPAQVMHDLTNDHPTENDLIPSVRQTLEKTRQFVVDHKIVTVPSGRSAARDGDAPLRPQRHLCVDGHARPV